MTESMLVRYTTAEGAWRRMRWLGCILGLTACDTGSTAVTETSCVADSKAYADATPLCRQLCDTKLSLECSLDDCGCYDCDQGIGLIAWCDAELTTSLECQAAQDRSQYSCVNDESQLSATACDAEAAAVSRCWCEGPSGGLPDPQQLCAAYCDVLEPFPCALLNCFDDCMQRLTDDAPQVKAARAAQAGFFQCVLDHRDALACEADQLLTGPCAALGEVVLFCRVAYMP